MADLHFEEVTKVYRDGTIAVEGLDLHVEDGEFFVFLGPSGCGKTTILRMVAGLEGTTDGRIYIRYVPSADKVGDRTPSYLTVGTYPTKNAFQEIQLAAARQGGVSAKIDHGGLLVFNNSNPKSVYFSYPKSSSQVEVYDPSPLQARALVLGGSIKPIR